MYRSNQQRYRLPIPITTTRIRPTRLVRVSAQLEDDGTQETVQLRSTQEEGEDTEKQSANHLMQVSGMHQAIHATPAPTAHHEQLEFVTEEWWPAGIQQTGPLAVMDLDDDRPSGYTEPISVTTGSSRQRPAVISHQPRPWRWFRLPWVKVLLGTLVGLGLLVLVMHFANMPAVVNTLKKNLTTPRGILLALLSGVAFLLAFSIRGWRWQLFLRPIGQIQLHKAIQLYLISTFLNFVLPVRGGEVAKCVMLRRISGMPISQSLPTVAMDKTLDLMPAFFIMALLPLLGIHMDIKIWLLLAVINALLLLVIGFVLLTIWKRDSAIELLQSMSRLLPPVMRARRIENMATGFVAALLAGTSRPAIFVPAVSLTLLAVICDGLFAMLAFWTIGAQVSFGTAIFGYTIYNMFYILPTPPGQVGSNEAVGLLIFYGLMHISSHDVATMFFFSHPWTALLMCGSGMGCLAAMGLTISGALQKPPASENKHTIEN
ncbi:lysylphosphatidylglycerol synthase transmembrane domain-containing protein [Dictyobacter formicarum]|uniref:Flippase-like domain-containing protein n=1 Tax=Dictyobacter formicarum TaxID=2778368 RepID=A0ABQ3VTH3_9CHLR|nr:lysylphosphatidylglycerol synthase transmembrane domain-containing protein [Dictyobacter formicarum]GHO88999.1 hypothetical protein KSZ_70050 [Dictyobacter formicarum]